MDNFYLKSINKVNSRTLVLTLSFLIYLLQIMPIYGQGMGGGTNISFKLSEVRIHFEDDSLDQSNMEIVRATILNKIHIFPRDYVSYGDLDLAMMSIQSIPEVGSASYDLEVSLGESFILHIYVTTQAQRTFTKENVGVFSKHPKGSFPYLFRNQKFIAKLDISAGVTVVSGDNAWLGNGELFTKNSPFGQSYPEDLYASLETALMPGITVVVKVFKNTYVYGNYKAIFVSTLGQDLFRSDNPADIATENALGGVIGTIPTASGNVINYHISAGRQPYKLGTGLFFTQISYNGGDRAGANLWPRYSGDLVAFAQLGFDDLKGEVFYLEPSEFGAIQTHSKFIGVNFEYGKNYGFNAGFTYLHALKSNSIVLFPNGEQEKREGLNGFNLRLDNKPKPGQNSIISNLELGLQTNSRFPAQAWALAAELGYAFTTTKSSPAFSYRFSHLTGDNPETDRYEKWDLLYAGGDVTSWVQGFQMKQINYVTNLQGHRFQAQFLVKGWRITGQYFYFRADQLNNLPLAINTFASKNLGHQAMLIVDKGFLKRFFLRAMFGSLWPLEGITKALPNEAKSPWTGFQAILKYNL